MYYLSAGSRVEVSSEEDGYRNAWFSGTVVGPPKPLNNPFPRTKKKKTAKVRYDHMLDEKNGELLVEEVSASMIRPAQPEDREPRQPLEPNVVVDAFHNDVWWTGYVVRLVGDTYTVAFKYPPDVLELKRSDLRVHLDWVDNSKWVQLPKEVTPESFYIPAMEIEVDLNKDKPGTTWCPGVYLGDVGHDLHLVKCNSDKGSEGPKTLRVHLKQIRPRPPITSVKDFELFDKVDALRGPFWAAGVITTIFVQKRYAVTFRHESKEMVFDHSEIRPHMDWTDHRWVFNSKVITEEEVQDVGNHATIKSSFGEKETCARAMENEVAIKETLKMVTEDCVIEVSDDTDTSEPIPAREEPQPCPSPAESANVGMSNGIRKECELPESPIENLQTAVESDIGNIEAVLAAEDRTPGNLETPTHACSKVTDPRPQVSADDRQAVSPHGVVTSSPNESALSFVKRRSVWQSLETLEALKKSPQSPHFQPLMKHNEEEREGLAFMHMVNYANMIDRITELREDDPLECVDGMKGRLAAYEELGFDVEAVRGLLDRWLDMRVRSESLQNKLKGIGSAAKENADETTRIDDEIERLTAKRALLIEERTERNAKMMRFTSESTDVEAELASTWASMRNLVTFNT